MQLLSLLAQQRRAALVRLKNINSHPNRSLESREYFKAVFGQLTEATRLLRERCKKQKTLLFLEAGFLEISLRLPLLAKTLSRHRDCLSGSPCRVRDGAKSFHAMYLFRWVLSQQLIIG
jgi:hypothetical protein